LAFTLTRAAAAAPACRVSDSRKLIGGDAALVDEVLDKGPDPSVVERLTPAEVDGRAVARATASFESRVRVGAVVQAGLTAKTTRGRPRRLNSTTSRNGLATSGGGGARTSADAKGEGEPGRDRLTVHVGVVRPPRESVPAEEDGGARAARWVSSNS
jgi:hypothetical protein